MIKYLELTAPEASAFRQAKILSIKCKEGDSVAIGSTLFRVKSGESEIDLPSTREGKIIEIIAIAGENITISTPLLLLETEVAGSTATPPIVDQEQVEQAARSSQQEETPPALENVDDNQGAAEKISTKQKKKNKNAQKEAKKVKDHQQQMLNLSDEVENHASTNEPDLQTVNEPITETSIDADGEPTNLKQLTENASMSNTDSIQITVPDIGTDSAKVIEILVTLGDSVQIEDPIVTLESDKASMDVPSTSAGVVTAINVEVDQDVNEGTIIIELASEAAASKTTAPQTTTSQAAPKPIAPVQNEGQAQTTSDADTGDDSAASLVKVSIPDIGGDSAKVIEILVKPGDQVVVEDPLVTLESDKASMDVPSSVSGVIESIEISVDDDVSEGTVVVTVRSADSVKNADTDPTITDAGITDPTITDAGITDAAITDASVTNTAIEAQTSNPLATTNAKKSQPSEPAVNAVSEPMNSWGKSHASPSIRRFARELGVDLSKVKGSGRKSRVNKEDVKAYVKVALTAPVSSHSTSTSSGTGIPQIPAQDFSKFGEIDIQPLNRIKRLTATNLHRSWLNVPHVTHNDESNINDLDTFRKQLNEEYKNQGRNIKLSPLAFIVKAVVNALRAYPQFNSSLEPGGENLIYKKYFNIGIAVETPNGLVVPVIKDVDKKSVAEIAQEMGDLAGKARDKKLSMNDMSGACITISSLGGIGGTSFTPIVNAPEVAILGVSRSKIQPVWNGSEFIPGMMLPLSLSYDHRVIDGAEAARFTRHIAAVLEDVRRLTV